MLERALEWYYGLFPDTFWGRITANVVLWGSVIGAVTTLTKFALNKTWDFVRWWMSLPAKIFAWLAQRFSKRS